MQRLFPLAILVLLSVAVSSASNTGDPTKPVTPPKKKPAVVSAAKRSKVTPPATSHARSRSAAIPESTNGRVSTRRVVVTRKKVNGRWVRTTRVVRAAPGPSYQVQPEPERYIQIQQALAAKGFFKGEPNGKWGDDSVDALKRYQASANLLNDGKIGSLSLIGLGLGPKHDGSITPPSAQQ